MGQDSPNQDAVRPGLYRFDDIEVDVAAHTLKRGGEARAIEPKAFAVLLALLRRPGELVGHEELLDGVWGHRHVTPGVLTRAIAQLRAVLADDPHHPRYIQTRHALGYSFIGALLDGREAHAPETPVVTAPAVAEIGDGASPGASVDPAAVAERATASGHPEASSDRAGHARHWRFRHWVAASLAAMAILGLVAGKEWLQRSGPVPREPSIAVMPFTALSDDSRDRHFAEGLSIELLNALAGLPGMKVAAWRPAGAIDRKQDVRDLGKTLGVATILDASVGRDGDRLRISARLSDTRTGYTIWSRSYDREATAVFDTQSDLAREVAEALLGVLPDAGKGLSRRLTPTRSVAAFDAYLQGLTRSFGSGDPEAIREAEGQFRKALSEDAGFARAQAQLCRLEAWRFETYRDPGAFDSARTACAQAASMDQDNGEVGLAMGDLYRVKGDLPRALRHYDALLDDPALRTSALIGRAQVFVDRGEESLAMEQFRQAVAASPGNAQVHAELGYQQYRLGHYAEAVESYRRAVALRPDVGAYWSIYGGVLLASGDNEAAEAALRRALSIEPGASALSNLGEIRLQAGDRAGAAALFRQAADLNPAKSAYLGYLGDALRGDPATSGEARAAYAGAAERAQRYVEMKPDDAVALAALGWYRANLGDSSEARRLLEQAEALKLEPGEVALYAAQTYALLGDPARARERFAAARAAGVPERRIAAKAALAAAGPAGRGGDPVGQGRQEVLPENAGASNLEN